MTRLTRLCTVLLVALLASALHGATYGGGTGTAGDPYQIRTPAQMNTIGATSTDWGAAFKLMADIDLSAFTGTQYNTIGNTAKAFTGTFDGGGHVIRNFTYTNATTVWYVGIFGRTGPGAAIRSLGVENVSVSAAGYYVAGFVGENQGTLSKCFATGTVTGIDRVGGLVAANTQGTLDSCYAIVDVSGSHMVGGLLGENDGTLVNCYARGSCIGTDSIGGLVGYNHLGTLVNCYAAGVVGGTTEIGGLIGYNDSGTAQNSFWDLEASGKTDGVGSGSMPGVYGRLTWEMQQLMTFDVYGWDFVGIASDGAAETWRMCTDGVGYPQLNWENVRVGDFVCPDGTLRTLDLRRLAADWLTTYPSPLYGADANGDNKVNFMDFAIMAAAWIE
jgi:hypothetical protein